jgi:hypothetical protein
MELPEVAVGIMEGAHRILVELGQYTKHCIGYSWGIRAFLGGDKRTGTT